MRAYERGTPAVTVSYERGTPVVTVSYERGIPVVTVSYERGSPVVTTKQRDRGRACRARHIVGAIGLALEPLAKSISQPGTHVSLQCDYETARPRSGMSGAGIPPGT